jgi:LPS-assembly lipoprotein
MKRFLALALIATPVLGGCGLHPLYEGGSHAAVSQGLDNVDVPAIPGQKGWLMRNALEDRMHPTGNRDGAKRFRLDVRLDDKLEGLGLLANDSVGRERRTLRARYQLVDTTTGEILLDSTAGSDAGIDVVSSEYATVAAEQTALENLTRVVADRIVTSLAVRLRKGDIEADPQPADNTPQPKR